MKDGRHIDNDSKRDSARTSETVADGSDFGDVVRTIDRGQSSNAGQDNNIRAESIGSDANNQGESRGNQRASLPSGFYFTPSGDVARIPDGYYIGNGRLRKRRATSNRSDSTDGNEDRNRTETGNESQLGAESYLREKPLKVGGTRKRSKVSEAQQRLTMVAMLSVACTATFTSIALLTKHEHWYLETEEVKPLAEAFNDAFATLPTKAYETIIAIIEKWTPWINLVFVLSAIIVPRIEASIKRVETTRYQPNRSNDGRDAGTEASSWPNEIPFNRPHG